ncbi:MAG TPA: hypothetical protein VET87_12220 [Rubrivivax sp.]|jgi:hypothetical protein|nr:hypothetical protein [Rubrivivax sp.]
MPAFTLTIAGALVKVSPSNAANNSNNRGCASARFGRNGVHPSYFQISQTSTPWEPQS